MPEDWTEDKVHSLEAGEEHTSCLHDQQVLEGGLSPQEWEAECGCLSSPPPPSTKSGREGLVRFKKEFFNSSIIPLTILLMPEMPVFRKLFIIHLEIRCKHLVEETV